MPATRARVLFVLGLCVDTGCLAELSREMVYQYIGIYGMVIVVGLSRQCIVIVVCCL